MQAISPCEARSWLNLLLPQSHIQVYQKNSCRNLLYIIMVHSTLGNPILKICSTEYAVRPDGKIEPIQERRLCGRLNASV